MKLLSAIATFLTLLLGGPLYLLESGKVPENGDLIRLWRVEGLDSNRETPLNVTPIGATLSPLPLTFSEIVAGEGGLFLIGGEKGVSGWRPSIQFRDWEGGLKNWWRGERGVGVSGGICPQTGTPLLIVEEGGRVRWGGIPPKLLLTWGRGRFLKLLPIGNRLWLFSSEEKRGGTTLRWGPVSEGVVHFLPLSPGVHLTEIILDREGGKVVAVGVWNGIPHLWGFQLDRELVGGGAFRLPGTLSNLKGVKVEGGYLLVGELHRNGGEELCWCRLNPNFRLLRWGVVPNSVGGKVWRVGVTPRGVVVVGGVPVGESQVPALWVLGKSGTLLHFWHLTPKIPIKTHFTSFTLPIERKGGR